MKHKIAIWGMFAAACATAADLPPEGSDDAKRPYEMVWAGRTEDANAPALVPFTDPAGWTIEATNAVASVARATDRLLFGDGVTPPERS